MMRPDARPPIGRRGHCLRAKPARKPFKTSEQSWLGRTPLSIFADGLGDTTCIDAKHCRDIVHIVTLTPQECGGGDLVRLECLAVHVYAVQDNPRDGVSKRSHGVNSMMAAGALGAGNTLGPCGAADEKLAASLRADDVESSARIAKNGTDEVSVNPTTPRYCGKAGSGVNALRRREKRPLVRFLENHFVSEVCPKIDAAGHQLDLQCESAGRSVILRIFALRFFASVGECSRDIESRLGWT